MKRRRLAPGTLAETAKWCSAVGGMVTLILSLLAAPLAAEAQQPEKVPPIGFLGTLPTNPRYEALRQGLQEAGYIEGRNIAVERTADSPSLAAAVRYGGRRGLRPLAAVFGCNQTF